MIKVSLWLLCIGVIVYASFCLLLFLRQRSLIFYPHPATTSGSAEILWLERGLERLKIWQVKRDEPAALIYFGGNAEDVSLNLDHFQKLFPERSLYLMNYRGYGGSTGTPTEEGLLADSRELYEHIATVHQSIVVMGRSLGTAVAVHLAAEKPVDGLILITPYSSMVDLARHYYPFLPVGPLLKDRFESILAAPHIDVPVLALIAERDEIIPRRISDALIDAFKPGLVRTVVIEGTHHNTIDSGPDYDQYLDGFVRSLSAASE